MNTTRSTITTAAFLALAVITPAAILLGITYQLSRNETISSTVFFGAFIADLIGVFWWLRQHVVPTAQPACINVHQFVAHMKMHPELMPAGMSEFDLERFRTSQRRRSPMGLEAWLKRFRQSRAATKAVRPSSQFR